MNTSIRFGTLYHLQVEPREQALADPNKVIRSGKVNKAVIDAEFQKTGKREGQTTLFLQEAFYSIAGESVRELEKLEADFIARLPKIEQFVLERADDEEQIADVLGRERLEALKSESLQAVTDWVNGQVKRGEVPSLRIDLNA